MISRRHRGAFEIGLAVLAAVAYFGVRNLTEGRTDRALAHAVDLFAFEQDLHLDLEARIQAVVDEQWLVNVVNWVYIWGHWPVIITSMVALYWLRPEHYVRLRNAFFISGAIGLVIFALYPVAPPRLAGLGLVDTVTIHSHSYRVLQPPGFTNRYAALPSLHAGWNLILAVVVWQAVARWWVRAGLVALATAMTFSVVATANHFVLDVIAGISLAVFGLLVASWAGRLGDGVEGEAEANPPGEDRPTRALETIRSG